MVNQNQAGHVSRVHLGMNPSATCRHEHELGPSLTRTNQTRRFLLCSAGPRPVKTFRETGLSARLASSRQVEKRRFKLTAKIGRMDYAYTVDFDCAGCCLGDGRSLSYCNGQGDNFLDIRSPHVLIAGKVQDVPVNATAQEPTL